MQDKTVKLALILHMFIVRTETVIVSETVLLVTVCKCVYCSFFLLLFLFFSIVAFIANKGVLFIAQYCYLYQCNLSSRPVFCRPVQGRSGGHPDTLNFNRFFLSTTCAR